MRGWRSGERDDPRAALKLAGSDASGNGRTTRHPFLVLAISAVAFALMQSLVIPVPSPIQVGMHASSSSVAWLVTANLLSASIATPIMGRFGMLGRKRALVITLLLLAGGSVLAAVAPTMGVMIAAPTVQGLGGGVLPLGCGIIRDEFSDTAAPGAVGAPSALPPPGPAWVLCWPDHWCTSWDIGCSSVCRTSS